MFACISSKFSMCLFIFALFFHSTLSLRCFECDNCQDLESCKCSKEVSYDNQGAYCILLRQTQLNGVLNIEIKHLPRNFTTYVIDDPDFISVEELIAYNAKTDTWFSQSNKIIYGCQTDGCNRDSLLKQLPKNGLSLMLPYTWLKEQFQRKLVENTTACLDCESGTACADTPDTIDTNLCDQKRCQGSCVIGEAPRKTSTNTQYCYQSFCSDETSYGPEMLSPNISITAVYYLKSQRFSVVEIDAYCNGNDCRGLGILKDLKMKLQKNLDGIKSFLPSKSGSVFHSICPVALFVVLLQMISYY